MDPLSEGICIIIVLLSCDDAEMFASDEVGVAAVLNAEFLNDNLPQHGRKHVIRTNKHHCQLYAYAFTSDKKQEEARERNEYRKVCK